MAAIVLLSKSDKYASQKAVIVLLSDKYASQKAAIVFYLVKVIRSGY